MNDVSDTSGLKLISKIASIAIKGYAIGTPNAISSTDSFGIVAQQVGLVKVGVHSYPRRRHRSHRPGARRYWGLLRP